MARKSPAFAIVVLLVLAVPAGLGAQALDFSLNGIRFNNALLSGIPVPAGADVEFAIPMAAKGLLFGIRLGGGYEDRLILRDDASGASIEKPPFDNAHWFNWPNAQIDAGLVYKLPIGDKEGHEAPFEIFGRARGRYERNSTALGTDIFPDAQGLLAISFLGGTGVDWVYESPRRFKKGVAGEASFEYSPECLTFVGGTDFYRAALNLEGYVPLYTSGESDLDAVSVYGAAYFAADYAGGTHIPLYVLTSFGGRHLRKGLGDSIRGYQPWGYEATTKAEASFDLRLVGPGLFGVAGLRPMAYLFGDAGYYDGLYKSPIPDKNGLIFSSGIGAALDILDFAYLGLRVGYRFPVDDPLYATYFPGGDKFFWNIKFLLHF